MVWALVWALVWACGRPSPAPAAPPDAFDEALSARPEAHANAAPRPPFLGVDLEAATYVGAQACVGCHPAAARAWASSHHATALDTLREAQRAFDPACLRCHAVGFGHSGGFEKGRPELGGVGCESCHGPGSPHLRSPGAGYGQLPLDERACVGCHSIDNSPDFDWVQYWGRVAH